MTQTPIEITYKTFDPELARNLDEAVHAAIPMEIHQLAARVQANLPVDTDGYSDRVLFITALLSQFNRTERNHWFRAMEVAVSTACINEDISMNNETSERDGERSPEHVVPRV